MHFFEILFLILLLISSGVISSAEVCFFSNNNLKINLKNENYLSYSEKKLRDLLSKPNELLALILIWNNVVNIIIILLFNQIIDGFGIKFNTPLIEFLVKTILILLIILIMGELLPKILSSNSSEKLSLIYSIPFSILKKISKPFTSLLLFILKFVQIKLKKKKEVFTIKQITNAIKITKSNKNTIDDIKIIDSISKLEQEEAREIMKPSTKILALNYNQEIKDVILTIDDYNFSRLPVYKENIDNIIGFVHIKDILLNQEKITGNNWTKYIREIFFIPENFKLSNLLKEFKEKKSHLAIVKNEYGETTGLITLEDLVEEIVGEIHDEFDDEESKCKKINSKTYHIDGEYLVNDFCKQFNITDIYFKNELNHAETLAGIVVEKLGKIPLNNEVINFPKFNFKILKSDHRKIKTIEVNFKD